jgi:hypothetical protein
MKQETLEDAVKSELEFIHNSCRNFDFDLGFKTGGLIGAKWQQEQNENKYSEEIIDILDNVRYWETCPDNYKVIIEKFIEQFKKK